MGQNVLFVSNDGLSGDLAWQVSNEGHDIKYVTDNRFSEDVAQGFVDRPDAWRPHVDWADLIVFDDAFGLGAEAERLRADGHAVVGGTERTDRLEEDRDFGQQMFRDIGLTPAPYHRFTSFDDALDFLREEQGRWVFKPEGEAQNFKELLYVSRDEHGRDLEQMLETYRDRNEDIDRFILQRYVEGVEVGISAFFNGERFLRPFTINVEHKHLFPGDIGPLTAEMGTLTLWKEEARLFDETLAGMADFLREEGFRGSIDIYCIINDDGIVPLEFTPRFGYPIAFIQSEAMTTPLTDVLTAVATGTDPDLSVRDGFHLGARAVVPPYPFDDDRLFREEYQGRPIRFRDGTPPDGLHIEDVKRTDGEWRVAGATGEVFVVTGSGETVAEARGQMHDRMSDILLPNMYYRNDIGKTWSRTRQVLDRNDLL